MSLSDIIAKISRPRALASSPELLISGTPTVTPLGIIDPKNPWYQATDPCVAVLPDFFDRESLIFTGISTNDDRLYCRVARSTNGPGTAKTSWTLQTDALISPGLVTEWDGEAIETPCFVKGMVDGKPVSRIYYMGRKKTAPGELLLNAQIGFAEWNGAKWVKHPVPVITPTESWENVPNFGCALGDQSVVYDPFTAKWYCFYNASRPDQNVTIGVAESQDGITWTNKQQANWAPPAPQPRFPNGPYHISVTIFEGQWYFVGWLPRSSVWQQGIWVTKSSGPMKIKSTDFATWKPLLYEDGATWFAPTDANVASTKAHEIGLFSSQLYFADGIAYLFFHAETPTVGNQGRVGNVGRATVSLSALKF